MAVPKAAYPNLPGVFESGPFRLRLNKFHGPKQISRIYKEKMIAAFKGMRADLTRMQCAFYFGELLDGRAAEAMPH